MVDFLAYLPAELVCNVLERLSAEDLSACAEVSLATRFHLKGFLCNIQGRM